MASNFPNLELESTDDPVQDAWNLQPDVVVVAIGEDAAYAEKPGDIRDIGIPSSQVALVSDLRFALPSSTKIIAAYLGGRPRVLPEVVSNVDGFIASFLPGPNGGKAIADVIKGEVNPSGKLPLTWPIFKDGGRRTYDTMVTDLCTKSQYVIEGDGVPNYEYVECEVQWMFGSGLSYSEFEETFVGVEVKGKGGKIEGDDVVLSPLSSAEFTVKVKNAGDMSGRYTSMVFYETVNRRATPRKEELFSFVKTGDLEPGEEVIVTHVMNGEDLKFFGMESGLHWIYEPGMTSLIKIGNEGPYCRTGEGGSKCLSKRVVVSSESYGRGGVCGYSCDALVRGCPTSGFESHGSCVEKCQADGERGRPWTFDYVDCVERVADEGRREGGGCQRLQTECRDVRENEYENMEEGRDVTAFKGGVAAFGLGGLIMGFAIAFIVLRLFGRSNKGLKVPTTDDLNDGMNEGMGVVEMKRMDML